MKLNIDDEQGIELLHFIFEREFKPPFREDDIYYKYFNRDNKIIGRLDSRHKKFAVTNPFRTNIEYKVCQAFEFSRDTTDWWIATKPHLKSWLESQLNIKLKNISV